MSLWRGQPSKASDKLASEDALLDPDWKAQAFRRQPACELGAGPCSTWRSIVKPSRDTRQSSESSRSLSEVDQRAHMIDQGKTLLVDRSTDSTSQIGQFINFD